MINRLTISLLSYSARAKVKSKHSLAASIQQIMAMSVYVTRNVPQSGISLLEKEGINIKQWKSDDPVPRDELESNIKDVDGLFCLLTDKIDKPLLEKGCLNLLIQL